MYNRCDNCGEDTPSYLIENDICLACKVFQSEIIDLTMEVIPKYIPTITLLDALLIATDDEMHLDDRVCSTCKVARQCNEFPRSGRQCKLCVNAKKRESRKIRLNKIRQADSMNEYT